MVPNQSEHHDIVRFGLKSYQKQSLNEQISWESRPKTHLPSFGVLYMPSFVTNLARELFLFLLPMVLILTTNVSVVST